MNYDFSKLQQPYLLDILGSYVESKGNYLKELHHTSKKFIERN